MSLKNWSTTAGSNATVDSINFAEGQAPSSLNDSARALMVDVKAALYNKGSDIASATTTDLAAASTEGLFHDITGTTTITGLGTVAAGVWKVIKFENALTLTHNGTSLILPGAANITTADGDVGIFVSEGSGNWRCVSYQPAARAPAAEGVWTNVTYASGDFSGNGSMTWTVESGDVSTFQYMIVNKTMWVNFYLLTTSIGGTPNSTLYIKIPASKSAVTPTQNACAISDNGTARTGTVRVNPGVDGATLIAITILAGGSFAASTNNSAFLGQLCFQIA